MWLKKGILWKRILSGVLAMALVISMIPSFQVAAADETVTIKDHVNNSTNAGNSGVNGFYFKTDGDELDYATDWSIRYGEAVSGGITVEGAQSSENSGGSGGAWETEGTLPISGTELVANTTIVSADGSKALTASASSKIMDGVDCGDPGASVMEWLISLPKINYSKYETVSMQFKGSAEWQSFGFSQSKRLSDGGSGSFVGTITITNNGDGTLKVVISASSHNQSIEETITDVDIINGTKPFTLSWLNGAAYRHMHIGPITGVEKENAGDSGSTGETTVASGSALVGNTIIVSADGSKTLTASASSKITDGVDCGDPGASVMEWLISLPKIDYSGYETVSMQFKGSAEWQSFGFSQSKRLSDGGSGSFDGTITITNNGNGTLKAVILASSHNQSIEETITDVDIINGTKAFTLSWLNGAAYRHMHIGPIMGVLKENTGDSGTEADPESGAILVTMLKTARDTYFVDLIVAGVTPISGTKVTIQGTYTDGTDNVTFRRAVFGFDGAKWVLEETETEPTPIPVTIQDHEYNATNEGNSGIRGFYFTTQNDGLDYDTDGGIRYDNAISGGITVEAPGITIGSKEDYVCVENVRRMIEIPKLDYSLYKNVSFSWGTTGWTQAGYGNELWFYGTGEPLSGTVTIVNNGTNSLEVTMEETLVGQGAHTVIVNDAAIYNGTQALTLAANNFVGTQTFTIGEITAIESNEWADVVLTMLKLDVGTYFVDLTHAGVIPTAGVKVTINGTYSDGTNAVQFEEKTFEFDGTKWAIEGQVVEPGGEPEDGPIDLTNHKKSTVYIADHENNVNNWGGSGLNGFYFKTNNDPLAYRDDWTVRYTKPASGGVYVDGNIQDVQIVKYAVDNYYVSLAESGITVNKGTQVVIDGAYYDKEDVVTFKRAIFTFDGSIWTVETEKEPVDLSKHKKTTVFIKNHENNLAGFGGSGENGFYFKTDNDPLAYGNDWTVRYTEPAAGGIYVNGTLTEVQLIKCESDTYYVGLVDSGLKATKGMQIVIDGAYYDKENVVTFKKASFTFDGKKWSVETEKEDIDLSKYKQATTTIKDHENNLAGFGGSGENGFYFRTNNDPLKYEEDWSVRYIEPARGGVYVDGILTPIQLIKHKADTYYVGLIDSGLKATKGMQIIIDGVFCDDEYAVTFKKATFTFNGSRWTFEGEKEQVDLSKHKKVTVKVMDSDMNLGNSSTRGFYFKTEDCPLAFSTDWQTRYFVSAEGGIYLDGELKTVQLIKHGENQYFVGLIDSGLDVLVKKGTKVTIAGSFYDDKYVVKFEKATFVFDGRFWMMEQEGADVEVQDMSEVTTYDLYEFTKTLSTTVCRKSSTVIGGLDNFRNTSLKMKVNINEGAWELLIGLGKNSTNNMWLGDGYQIVIQPSNELVLIRCDISTNVAAGYCEIPEEFILEVGMVDVATMDGEYYGTRVFVKIDGVEVASWVDSNTARVIGRNIMYYAPDTVNAMLYTARELITLPVHYVIDGEEKESCSLITPSQVMLDEANYYVVKKKSEQNVLVKDVSLKLNGEEAKLVAENSYSYTFLIYPKSEKDTLTITVETAERTVDAPIKVLDLYEVAGSIATNNTVVGNMLADGEALHANVAMQFIMELPDKYKESAIGMASAVDEIFRTKGYTILFSPNGVSIRHGAAHNELSFGSTELFKPGSSVYVECGIVKCYENGVYKYDSIYIKAGDTLENLEYVTWYDSTRRGGYDSGVVSNGVATLRTAKQMYTLTDASAASQKEKLASVEQYGETLYQVYYPNVIAADESARIVLYTKEGTSVKTMEIDGKKVEPISQQDGVYVYVIEAVVKDSVFAYTIKED